MGFYGRKLIRRLREEFGLKIPDDIRIRPCRPGWATRSSGGFNWTFESKTRPEFSCVGSQHTVRECAMADQLAIDSQDFDCFIDIVKDNFHASDNNAKR